MNGSKLSALIFGAITVAIGTLGILSGFGLLPKGQGDPAIPIVQQQALAICIGVVFAAGGASAMLSAFGGCWAHIVNSLFGFLIVVGLTSLFVWVAIGPGSRGFSSPLAIFGPCVNEISGRILFGFAAFIGFLIAALVVRSIGRLARLPTD